MLPDQKRTYETKELLASVRSCGFKVNEDLLRDFQKQGLMSYPAEKRGKGRAQSVYGIWTEQQRELLRTLCMMKEKHKWKPSQSCNLPVWVWLYWGDEYGVTFDQVKRSMGRWASHYQKQLSHDRSRQAASQVVKQVHNYKGDQRAATNKMAEAFYKGGGFCITPRNGAFGFNTRPHHFYLTRRPFQNGANCCVSLLNQWNPTIASRRSICI